MRGRVVAVAAALALTALGGTGSAMASTGGVQPTLILASGQILTWSVSPSPNRGTGDNVLNGVSCVSATACTAAGYSINSSGVYRTLIESWNGTSWSVVPSPNRGTATAKNFLSGVSCVSVTACTAAGFYANLRGVFRTLIESWNGTSWSIVPSPNGGTGRNVFDGVSCVSVTACTAVGNDRSRTLIESWDGISWAVVPSPNPGTGENVLDGVSCVSVTACTAAGFSTNLRGVFSTLIESWNGTSRSVVPSPNPTVSHRYLYGVSCVSATACTAAGYSTNASGVSGTLIESWYGTSWAIVPSPNPGTGFNGLFGVSCVSATACTAAGSSSSSGTLIESWDGTSWSIVPSPSPGSGTASNVFFGVSCISPTACTAAGSYYSPTLGTSKTLVEFGTATG
jgi:hypothetical protein